MLFNLFIKKMKKVVLFFAVATAVALASCGGNKQANTEAEEVTEPVEAVEVVEEVVVIDSAEIVEIPAEIVVEEVVAE